MPYSIPSSSKIFTLAILPFLFILVSTLPLVNLVSGVYISLCPQEIEVHSPS